MSIGLGRMEMGRVFFVQSFVESVLKIRKRSIVKICMKMVARVYERAWLLSDKKFRRPFGNNAKNASHYIISLLKIFSSDSKSSPS